MRARRKRKACDATAAHSSRAFQEIWCKFCADPAGGLRQCLSQIIIIARRVVRVKE